MSVDRREKRSQQRLSAIMVLDVVGYARIVERDDAEKLNAVKLQRTGTVEPEILKYNGRVVDRRDEGLIAEFSSIVDAVECGLEIQCLVSEMRSNARLRIGIHLGNIILENDIAFGDGIGLASQLAAMAKPGSTYLSAIVYDSLPESIGDKFFDAGKHTFENPNRTIRIFSWPSVTEINFTSGKPTLSDKPSVVLLPFDILAADTAAPGFADDVLESLTAMLARFRSIFVIDAGTGLTFKGRPFEMRDVGDALGVTYALEGDIRQSRNDIRISVRLIVIETGVMVWSRRFEGLLERMFELFNQIIEQLGQAIDPSSTRQSFQPQTDKMPLYDDAHALAVRTLPLCRKLERYATAKAIGDLDQALALDNENPLALALAARCRIQQFICGWSADLDVLMQSASELAEKAATFTPENPTVLTVLGTVHTMARRPGTASVLLHRAVTLDANSFLAWNRLGWLRVQEDDYPGALVCFGKSIHLSPFDPGIFDVYAGMAAALHADGQDEAAIRHFEQALEKRPNAHWIYPTYAAVLHARRDVTKADSIYSKMMQAFPNLNASQLRKRLIYSPQVMEPLITNLEELGLPA